MGLDLFSIFCGLDTIGSGFISIFSTLGLTAMGFELACPSWLWGTLSECQ
jgi:hypothetical protein